MRVMWMTMSLVILKTVLKMMEVNLRVLQGKPLKDIQESDQSLLTLLIAVKIWLNLTSTLLKTKFLAVLKVRGRLKFL